MLVTYRVAIPSYRRAEMCRKKTLNFLILGGVPMDRITVFVANTEERDAYAAEMAGQGVKIVIGELGLVRQREFIRRYYPEGTMVVNADDDVSALTEPNPVAPNPQITILKDADAFFSEMFRIQDSVDASMWGIYPIDNRKFMLNQKRYSIGLVFVVGSVWGHKVSRDSTLNPSAAPASGSKEDYERILIYWSSGRSILRCNHVTAKSKYYSEDGGISALAGGVPQRREMERQAVEALTARYPQFVRVAKVRNAGYEEIRLKNRGLVRHFLNPEDLEQPTAQPEPEAANAQPELF